MSGKVCAILFDRQRSSPEGLRILAAIINEK